MHFVSQSSQHLTCKEDLEQAQFHKLEKLQEKLKNFIQVNLVVEVIDWPALNRQEKREKGDHVET